MPYRREIRMPRGLLVLIVVFLALSLGAIAYVYPDDGSSSLVLGLAALSLLFVLGIADFAVSKIVLGETSLDVIELFRRRSYPRAELTSVKVDGGRVCLKRVDGDWVTLPDTGRSSLGVCNSVRAWLKETA